MLQTPRTRCPDVSVAIRPRARCGFAILARVPYARSHGRPSFGPTFLRQCPLPLRPQVDPFDRLILSRVVRRSVAVVGLGRSERDAPIDAHPRHQGGVHYRKRKQVSKKIYVGNLPFSSSQEDLEALFGRHGSVASVNVITDRETGRPRGFAFVEMESASDADDAIRALDGSNLDGRDIRVNEAQDRRAGGGGQRGNRF